MRNPSHSDPAEAAALYLSDLDHESLYSNAELSHAIAETVAAFGDHEQVLGTYADALASGEAASQEVRRRRRSWALRMADEIARTTAPRARPGVPRPGDVTDAVLTRRAS
ncbi:hypothetical protein [Streptomyces cupreus]|uniref:Uncharacterized protein n=1 Tax=Streptomyces cupreus TaxID=2759956 RepID=A0A7X1MAX9_9ACTN|nr:hypothetical protein [Streptomyces cupreus]MBC2904824.1 hypothetical protein [Streptomyces cupreus]